MTLLDISSFQKAVAQLEEALKYCASELAKKDDKLALLLRGSAIQAFKFTYDLSLKMLKRYLSLTEPNPNAVDEMSFNELIHSELAVWKEYKRERGTTSHTYDQEKAQEVFEDIPKFLQDAKYLLKEIQSRQESEVG